MKKKFLLAIIFIIILLVGGLGYYTYFMYEKEEVTEKIDLTTDQIYEITKDFSDATWSNIFSSNEEYALSDGEIRQIATTSGYTEDNLYTIIVIEGIFKLTDSNEDTTLYELHSQSSNYIIEKDIEYTSGKTKLTQLVREYKDQLDKYEVTFKKDGNDYKFVSLKNTSDIDVLELLDLYKNLLNQNSEEADELSKTEMMTVVFNSFRTSEEVLSNYTYTTYDVEISTVDSNGDAYKDYSDESEELICSKTNESYKLLTGKTVRDYGKLFGLTREEVDNMDTSLWGCINDCRMPDLFYVFDREKIQNKLLVLFGTDNNIFSKSFSLNTSGNINYVCGDIYIIYDKNIDKVIVYPSGGCTPIGLTSQYIYDETYYDDTYKQSVFNIVVGTEYYESEYPKEISIYNEMGIDENFVGKINVSSEDDIVPELLKYKYELDKYEITYKKVGNYYKFVRIDYVE